MASYGRYLKKHCAALAKDVGVEAAVIKLSQRLALLMAECNLSIADGMISISAAKRFCVKPQFCRGC